MKYRGYTIKVSSGKTKHKAAAYRSDGSYTRVAFYNEDKDTAINNVINMLDSMLGRTVQRQ